MYDPNSPIPKRAALAKANGNTLPGDGVLFHGRGYVQLTWRSNYAKMGKQFGLDLTSDLAAANKVLQPDLAARIMFFGMEKGTFTSKKLSDYFAGATSDWKNARRIINGLDQAENIAAYARKFYAAISYTT
jgi:putative chitinase